MIDIICPYCYSKVNARLTVEKEIRDMTDGAHGFAMSREYNAHCFDCDVALSLIVTAHHEEWN